MRRLVAVAILLVLGACLPVVSLAAEDASSTPAAARAWPPPPAAPAVRWVRAVASPADWGVSSGFFGRIYDAIAGKEEDRFVRPTGVAEREGVLYVADPGVPALWIIDARQNGLVKVNSAGNTPLASPVAVALGPEGSVFVADSVLKEVFQFDQAGKLIAVAASAGLSRPAGLAFDEERRNLYVADSAAHQVTIYGPGGAVVRTFGANGDRDGEFNRPTHLALDRNGTLLVTDALNYRVQAFDRDGRFLWKIGHQGDGSGDFAAPKGVAGDSKGHVYVVDALFDAVQVFDRQGQLLLGFGAHGQRDGEFWLPGGLFITADDEICVADSYNRRIQVFRLVPNRGQEAGK